MIDSVPDDGFDGPEQRERTARALMGEGRSADAVALLQEGFVHLNAHEPGVLPCLCKSCIDPGAATTAVAGVTYHRDFVTAVGRESRRRVLFFWIPETLLGERKRVVRSVEESLRQRFPTST